MPTSLHIFAPSKALIATSNNPLSFFTQVSFLFNRNGFQVCLIIALSSIGMSMFSSANFKAFSNRGYLIEE